MVLLIDAALFWRWQPLGTMAMINILIFVAATNAVYFGEAWAGECVAISAICYARERYRRGAAWGLLALFVRELAAPFCLLATLLALHRRRWNEVAVWIGGGALYTVYFGVHAWRAFQHMRPGDVRQAHSWVYFGGLPFLLKLWQFNGLLLVAPLWVFAIAVVAIVAAWWAPEMPIHVRMSVVVYSVCFLVIGQPFNIYWGFLTAPLLALWAAYAVSGLRACWMTAGPEQSASVSTART
jgi:hypothetical protein